MDTAKPTSIKAIIGLGNPGHSYEKTRHSIGFRVVDALAAQHGLSWKLKDTLAYAELPAPGGTLLLIKPQTFMNNSGQALPFLLKRGIQPAEIIVVHDELEKPFGTVQLKFAGSHKGHNGLKSLIAVVGPDFWRLRCGIGRPDDKNEVSDYVLKPFSEPKEQVEAMIQSALNELNIK